MKKILIIGNSGSGKSWLSKRLSEALNLKEINLDTIVWEPGGYNKKRSQEAIDKELQVIASESEWVVEGVFGALAEKLLDDADTLLFLDMPWELCKRSLLARGSESAKQLDSELAEKRFQELLVWAFEYSTRQSKSSFIFHQQLFTEFKGDKFCFNRREQVADFLSLYCL